LRRPSQAGFARGAPLLLHTRVLVIRREVRAYCKAHNRGQHPEGLIVRLIRVVQFRISALRDMQQQESASQTDTECGDPAIFMLFIAFVTHEASKMLD
jgi:hypothetical protein